MNTAIELHDSECVGIEFDPSGSGAVVLDAYIHRTEGEPGVSPGDGGVQRVRISMEEMTTSGEIGSLPATIYEGALALDQFKHDNIVPIPLKAAGKSKLSLMLADDARMIHVSGRDISIEPAGEFSFVERVDFSHRDPGE